MAAAPADTRMEEISKIRTMRDVFDFCNKYNLCSVAQGMIELPPPALLRKIIADEFLVDSHVIHQYGARIGAKPYLEAVIAFMKSVYNITVPADCVMAASGVSGAIVATLLALRSRNKTRVAILEPFYTYHKRQVEEALGTCDRFIPCNMDDFSPNFDLIEAEMKKGLDCLIVCNPGNPSGRVWTAEEMRSYRIPKHSLPDFFPEYLINQIQRLSSSLERLVGFAEKYDVVIILDEIYCDMVWQGRHFTPLEDKLSKHVVVCRGWSKSLAGQSWRVGFCITEPGLLQQILTHHDPVYIAVNCTQYGIAKYIHHHAEDYKRHVRENGDLMKENWQRLKKLFKEELGWEPVEPHGSMYGLFRHKQASDIEALQYGLDFGIGVAPGNMFWGGDKANTGLIRIHYGFDRATVTRIEEVVKAKKAAKK